MAICFQIQVMRLIKQLFCALTVMLACLQSGLAQHTESSLTGFQAKYKAYRWGKELGHANLSLEPLGRQKYRLSYDSKVSLFFLSDQRQETSLFSYTSKQIVPYKYQYERSGTGSDKKLVIAFNHTDKTIKISDQKPIPWQGELDNQLYRLDVQLKLASGETHFEYQLLNNRGQIRHYKLEVMGKEQLDLPYGLLEGIKVKLVRESKKRETFAWFSPTLGYQLVRLQQFKEGDEQGDIRLSEFNRLDGPLPGG